MLCFFSKVEMGDNDNDDNNNDNNNDNNDDDNDITYYL